ncbi:MAG TPA: glycosyltransferase family 1 protein [Ignavibacteria bacterium]|nr:glycosyltransferase family 1 protein [Ignavibacteria bacterium]
MKFLYLTNHLNGTDGWSRYSLDLVVEIQNQGHEVLVLVNKKSNQTRIKEIEILGSPLRYLANPALSFTGARKISKIMKDFTPDIIHILIEPYATILPFLSVGKTKTFLTIHGTYAYIPNLFVNHITRSISKFLSGRFYKKINGIISVSEYTKKYLLRYYPELCGKIETITNGIDLQKFEPTASNQKSPNEIKQILFVGAIKKRKGILESIEAIKYYYNFFSKKFIFKVVGVCDTGSNYYHTVQHKIKEYGLKNNIIFEGVATDGELQQYYESSDLFLMLSINNGREFEGYGLVYLEANSKGVPCIGPNDSGVGEAILDTKTGYIVDEYNVKEVAEKINLILNNEAIDSQNCIDWAKRNDIKVKAKEIVNYYTICEKN